LQGDHQINTSLIVKLKTFFSELSNLAFKSR
jgi:hypothetical protein